MLLPRPRWIHWKVHRPDSGAPEDRTRPGYPNVDAWCGWLAGLALAGGVASGVQAALHLPAAQRLQLADGVAGYVRARAAGELAVFWPAASGWLRAAAPVWTAGLWPRAGVLMVALALGLRGFSLGMAFGTVAVLGPAGLAAAMVSTLPGNVFALPLLCYLGARAATLAVRRTGGGAGVPRGYLWLGAAGLGGVAVSSACEAALVPLVLRAAGVLPPI